MRFLVLVAYRLQEARDVAPAVPPSAINDEARHLMLPYLALMRPDAPQRHHGPRERFNPLRRIVRTGDQWDYLPHEFPVWTADYQRAYRRIAAGVFAATGSALRANLATPPDAQDRARLATLLSAVQELSTIMDPAGRLAS